MAISAGEKSPQELAIEQAVSAAIDSLRAAAPTLTKTQTVSVWKILKDSNPDIIAMDKLNIALIQENIFEVVDRENLESLLTEQKLSLTGLVDPEKMKELGQIYGVDAFIFGTERTEAGKTVLALQMIDVDTATVIWGEEAGKTGVAVTPGAEPTEPLDKIAYAATNSLGQAQELKVNTIAIGNLIGAPPDLSEKLSIRLTKSGRFKVIDRSKLELILKEQRLSLTGIIAPEKMKELGKLYGIDAFIFGRLSKTDEKTVTLVLKLLSVDTGELLWISKSIADFDFESIFGFGSMVQILAGWFLMGSRAGKDDEHPQHKVWVDAFLIDRYEVTNAQYEKFMKATGHEAPEYWDDEKYNKFNHPVVGVSWFDAVAYAKWAGKRLPTEAEWEKAARGGLVDKHYPWGDSISHDNANYGTGGRDRWEHTSPVGSFPPNEYGLYDMAGNVEEWCADWYDKDYYRSSPERNPKGPNTGSWRVLRGGSWGGNTSLSRCAYRFYAPSISNYFIGFRCAQDR